MVKTISFVKCSMYNVFSIWYVQFIKYFPKVWIFGMVERETNTPLLIYPVSDRSEDTLLPIIQRHLEPGSTIYSDGGVLTVDWTTLDTTISPFSTNTHLRKFTFRRILERKWRSILIALKGPGNTPKSIFVGCLGPRFRNLRAIYAK